MQIERTILKCSKVMAHTISFEAKGLEYLDDTFNKIIIKIPIK